MSAPASFKGYEYEEPERFSADIDWMPRVVMIAKSTLVWHPWSEKAKDMGDFDPAEWDKMVCIEAANVRESAITLAPGKVHTLKMQIRVLPR